MTNVADKLRTRPKRWPWLIAAPAAALLVVGTWAGASALGHPAPAPTATLSPYVSPALTPAELATVQSAADAQHATITDDAAKAAAAASDKEAALAAGHQEQSAGGPVKCAPGYTANAVDGDGNESNCQKNGPGGGQCVAYDDANNCTQYYKP